MPDPIPPIGAAYVAAATRKHGYVTKIFEACFWKHWRPDLAVAVDLFQPDIIGLSIRDATPC